LDEAPPAEQGSFDDAYRGIPPWDIGRPQKELVQLVSNGELKGKILDSGCGTGENSLYFARQGFEVVGADFSKRAIDKARTKAVERKESKVKFVVSDALNPASEVSNEAPFDTIVDCGLYHVFEGDETNRYIANISRLIRTRGLFFIMCFSDKQFGNWGPRRIPKEELESNFSRSWKINYVKDAIFENNAPELLSPEGAKAWLCSITKL
jgi:SAM-dependent methyltransferase